VDVQRFCPAATPDGPLTVVFASSPEKVDWLEARGVHLILDAAALCRDMRFRLVWRPWGDCLPEIRRRIEERGLSNVELLVGRFANMASQYQAAHVCVAPFTRPDRCKGTPNSLLESLACGRPIVVTPEVGLADVVGEQKVGIVCAANAESLAKSLDTIACDWAAFSRRARELAERRFAAERFLEAYDNVYKSLI
jgi:glycosyltransferase involved in cell wall biosynthesis